MFSLARALQWELGGCTGRGCPPDLPREALLPVICTPNEADLGWVEGTGPLPAWSPEEGSGRNDKCGKHPELWMGSASPMERDPKA